MSVDIPELKERIEKALKDTMEPDDRYKLIDLLRKKIIKRIDERIKTIVTQDMDLAENRTILTKLYDSKLREIDNRIELAGENIRYGGMEVMKILGIEKVELEKKLGTVLAKQTKYKSLTGYEETDELDEELSIMKLVDAEKHEDWEPEAVDASLVKKVGDTITAQPIEVHVFEPIIEDAAVLQEISNVGKKLHETIMQVPVINDPLPADDPLPAVPNL